MSDSAKLKQALYSLALTPEDFLTQTGRLIHEATTYVLDGADHLDELEACEKTYIGTKFEKRFLKHWSLPVKKKGSSHRLDTVINGVDLDLKFSISAKGSWMIPPEARNEWCLLINMNWPNTYSIGVLCMDDSFVTNGANRDGKVSVSKIGKQNIDWLGRDVALSAAPHGSSADTIFLQSQSMLKNSPSQPLVGCEPDKAHGVYVIYHKGEIAYVGKSDNLRGRLKKHARTISDAPLICNEDVTYSMLVCEKHFKVALESFLIENMSPPWNATGFGSNAHGAGRSDQRQSVWNQTYGRAQTR